MNLYGIVGAAVVAALLALLLKQYRSDFGLAVGLAAGTALLLYAVVQLMPLIEQLRGLSERIAVPNELLGVALKTLAVCYLVQFGADLCRDAGENAIAGKLELAGKVMVMILSLPLFRELWGLILPLLGE